MYWLFPIGVGCFLNRNLGFYIIFIRRHRRWREVFIFSYYCGLQVQTGTELIVAVANSLSVLEFFKSSGSDPIKWVSKYSQWILKSTACFGSFWAQRNGTCAMMYALAKTGSVESFYINTWIQTLKRHRVRPMTLERRHLSACVDNLARGILNA
jgi:hypothetical protein